MDINIIFLKWHPKMIAMIPVFLAMFISMDMMAQPNASIRSIEDHEYTLLYQAFECHDQSGTDYDTVRNKGDFIVFCRNGWAYMKFKGILDSLQYYFVDSSSVCFGDTPFTIELGMHDTVTMRQHEEDKNGNYNDVTYFLIEKRQRRFR